jgi:Fe2+ transport system protein FeoA
VIVEVVADLGIPERTPVNVLRVNPEGRREIAVKVDGASVVIG